MKIKINSLVVDMVAPSSSLSRSEFLKSLSIVRALGFQPRVWGKIQYPPSFFAQKEGEAFLNFKQALFSKDSQIIWCLRGGYGSHRLLKKIYEIKKIPKIPKLFIGYSDVTVIHDLIHQKFSWPTLHFSVSSKLAQTTRSSQKKFTSLFFKNQTFQNFLRLQVLNPQIKIKKITAPITGGNITMIRTLIGTEWSVSRKNQILFLEDNNEKPYAIDRSLWQMKEAGVFKNIRALIFGRWNHKSSVQNELIENVLKPFARQSTFPVILNMPCGHGVINDPLFFLTTAELTLKQKEACLRVKAPIEASLS